jgi:hypothetical protein
MFRGNCHPAFGDQVVIDSSSCSFAGKESSFDRTLVDWEAPGPVLEARIKPVPACGSVRCRCTVASGGAVMY